MNRQRVDREGVMHRSQKSGNGTVTTYGFDAVSRLASLAENLTGTTNDQSATFSYSPASQIGGVTRTNDLYAWTGHGSGSTASVANGPNQLTSIGGAATTHDTRGNLTTDPTTGKTYGYSSENLLKTATGGVTLAYDPLLRLYDVTGAATTRFAYDGLDPSTGSGQAMIAEYDGSSALQRRFVHGPAVDEPLVQYEGTGTTDRRWLHADERGSIIATSDASGNMLTINKYDEFGKPQATNAGRFQYTGQMWLGELGLYHYKARAYAPHLGRFLQTDPIGYWDSPNLYAYVGNDPVNWVDPLGLQPQDIFVTGFRRRPPNMLLGDASSGIGGLVGFEPDEPELNKDNEEIVVTYWRRQKKTGNPIAAFGLAFSPSSSTTWYSELFEDVLLSKIAHTPVRTSKGKRYPTAAEVKSMYLKVRYMLMLADINARASDRTGVLGLLSPGQIFNYHVEVFSRFNLSSHAFGPSYVFGSRGEAIFYAPLWCPRCDR